jgi:hypothetical protein
MFRPIVWFAGIALLLGGCARMPVNVPSKIGTAGLLVAEIRSNFADVNGIYRSLGTGEYQNLLAPEINGTTYERALRNGFLVLTLPPGEYRMTNLNHGTSTASFTSWLGSFSQSATTAYPLDIKFTIERGRATYLGKLYLYAPKRQSNNYAVVAVDDAKGMVDYLKAKYPQLYASLSSPELLPGPQEYVDPAQLTMLRKAIASRKVRDMSALLVSAGATKSDDWQARAIASRELMELAWEGDMTRTVQHVGGQLGALARLTPNPSGKVDLVPVDSGTLTGLDWCTFDQDRGICPLPESNFLLVRGSTAAQKPWPAGSAKPALLRVFGRSGIVAVDQNGLVWISLDDGATWKSHSWLALKEPMRVNEYDTSEPYSPVGFRRGKHGFYLYSRIDLKQESLLYVAYAGDGVRRIDLPAGARRVRGVIESPGQGLLVAAHPSGLLTNEMVYFMPASRQSWLKREIPAEFCPHFLPEQSGASLRLVCSQGQFRSVDLGKTWNKLPHDVAMR